MRNYFETDANKAARRARISSKRNSPISGENYGKLILKICRAGNFLTRDCPWPSRRKNAQKRPQYTDGRRKRGVPRRLLFRLSYFIPHVFRGGVFRFVCSRRTNGSVRSANSFLSDKLTIGRNVLRKTSQLLNNVTKCIDCSFR